MEDCNFSYFDPALLIWPAKVLCNDASVMLFGCGQGQKLEPRQSQNSRSYKQAPAMSKLSYSEYTFF
jgi:hypothetical protein